MSNAEINPDVPPAAEPVEKVEKKEPPHIDGVDPSLEYVVRELAILDNGVCRVAVPRCPRCGKPHYGTRAAAYRKPSPPWTHWFICPETHEPVSLYVAVDGSDDGRSAGAGAIGAAMSRSVVAHPRGLEIDRTVIEHMFDAQASGQWLAAVFYVQGGRLQMHRRTANFPREDLMRAVDLLRDNLAGEVGPPPLKELPAAVGDGEQIEPVVKLFGEG